MLEINLSGIKKTYGFTNVLDDVCLEIHTRDRIAIVGKNGAGKTTLFKIIKGLETYESGTLSIKKGNTIGFLQQIPPDYDDSSVKQVLMTAFSELVSIEEEMKDLETEMGNPNTRKLEKTVNRYGRLQEIFINKNGYEMNSELSKICFAFDISEDMQNQQFSSLSGGQKTVVHLATLLLEKPDILLLDEPTNHLDIKTIEWLEEFLKKYPGTVIINSHDRYFLDKVVNKIASLENGKCTLYHGNYSHFTEEQERELMAEFQGFKTQQKQIQAMKEAIKRYRDWGNRSSNEKFFKAAKNLEKRLERIETLDKPQLQKAKMPLNFSQNSRSGNDVIKVKALRMSYDHKVVLDNMSFDIKYGENVCLMGDNGSGKTTLVKIILKEIEPLSGEVHLGSNINIGYLSQHITFENENLTVLEEFKRDFSGSETQLRAILAKFYFNGENVFKKISDLSGGEKVRLKFAKMVQKDINFLILDEPTNHIDIETREMLEEALQEFKGTLLFVSHDRYFTNKLSQKIAELRNGKITYYLGNYDEYRERKDSKK